jgi:peroxiredoxin (alkyl hydroperoxide reductase subunit C)
MYKIGEVIPDFKAEIFQNNEIKEVNFADYRGKWVVMLFYPADFTFVCPTELEDAAEFYGKFKDVNAVIISVSTDTAYVHKARHDTSDAISKVEYPMMADPTGQICRDFGTYIDEAGLSLRGTFIIDPE